MDLKFYLQLFLRRIHWFLLPALLGSAVGLTLARVLPPTYQASATLVVESPQIPAELASSTVQTSPQEAIQIIQQRIFTRERLLDLANRLDIYAGTEPSVRARMSADDIVRDLRSRVWISLSSSGNNRNPGAQIVSVGAQAPRARLAADMTNEIVDMVLEENVAIRTAVASQTLDFFVQEVERLDRELSAKSAEILEFQRGNLNALPDSLEFRRTQQSAAQERLVRLEREEQALIERREALSRLFDETGRIGPPDPAQMSPEERQVVDLQNELDSALIVLSPQNPRIRVLQARLAAAQERLAAAGATAASDAPPVDPQRAAFDLQIADIDAQLRSIAEQKGDIEAQLQTLQETIDATPANGIRLATLQRDYDALRAQYERAVEARSRAETGDTIEALAKGQRISVIEQASVPLEPRSPDRPFIAAAGIGGGIAAGLALVLLLELLNPAIRRPVDIEAKLGILPIGALPYLRTQAEIWRRRAIIGGAFAIVAIGLPVALWYVHTYVTPLDLLIDRAVDQLRMAGLAGSVSAA